MITLFCLSVVCFASLVLVHLLFVRVVSRAAFVRNGYLFVSIVGAGLLPLALRLGMLGAAFFYLNLAILWNLYTIFLINLMNSVSLRMMVEIDNSPAQALSAEEIQALYSDKEALQSRLRGLVSTGFLKEEGRDLVLTRQGQTLARILAAIRRLFGIEFFG
jgi:hypothetical protein